MCESVQLVLLVAELDFAEAHLDGVELGTVHSIPNWLNVELLHLLAYKGSFVHVKVVHEERYLVLSVTPPQHL